jgi:ribonucleoside-triphosphate reductase
MQNDVQKMYTGGTVFHSFIGESITDTDTCKNLVRKIATNYQIPYFTITPTFSVCLSHGYLKGEQFSCPNCGEETEVYTRIVGYYRPVQNWNHGKKSEYKDRKLFDVDPTKEPQEQKEVCEVHSPA